MATGQENAVKNAGHKAEVIQRRLEASRPERHAALATVRRRREGGGSI